MAAKIEDATYFVHFRLLYIAVSWCFDVNEINYQFVYKFHVAKHCILEYYFCGKIL